MILLLKRFRRYELRNAGYRQDICCVGTATGNIWLSDLVFSFLAPINSLELARKFPSLSSLNIEYRIGPLSATSSKSSYNSVTVNNTGFLYKSEISLKIKRDPAKLILDG